MMRPYNENMALKERTTPIEGAPPPAGGSFVETALKLGGKSDEEARRTGVLDRADEQVEALFAQRHQTTASPIHRAVWERELPIAEFTPAPVSADAQVERVMADSLAVIER